MSHNTGHPVPSIDMRDFEDNAENLDTLLHSTDATWVDRLGESRPTIKHLEEQYKVTEEIRDEIIQAKVEVESASLGANTAMIASEAARDAALLSRGIWPTTAAATGQGVAGVASVVPGSGGASGTFALGFSGGTQVIAPQGYFVVAGGSVTQVVITYSGHYSAGAPTLSFSASAGLSGASATAVIAANTSPGQYFSVPQTSPNTVFMDLYLNNAGVAQYVNSYQSPTGITDSQITEKDYAARRSETFKDIGRFTKARTNGTSLTGFTATYNSGLDIVSTQSGRHVVVSTDFNTHEYQQSWEVTATGITINTNTIMVGVAIGPAGATRRQYLYRSNGQVLAVKDDETLDYEIAPASAGRSYVAGNIVKIKVVRKPSGVGSVVITLPNGNEQSFSITGVPSGPVWLAWRGDGNMHITQMYLDSIGADALKEIELSNVTELTPIKNAILFGSNELLKKMVVKLPVGFTGYIPDFGIYRFTDGSFFTDLDFEGRRPFADEDANSVLYVDVATGSDSNPGTITDPLKSIYAAVHGRTGKVKVYVKPGVYAGNDSWRDANPTSTNLIVEAWPGTSGRIISRRNNTGLTWSLTAGKTNTYQATIASVGSVVDAANVDANSDFTRLVVQSSVDNVEANAGSYYVNGTTVYVRTFNNRAPDASVLVFLDARNGRYTQNGGIIWVKGIDFEGGSRPMQVAATNIAHTCTGYLWDCSMKYAGGSSGRNGFNVDGRVLCFLKECIAAANVLDGFNYHNFSTSQPPITVEIDCIGRNNGHESGGTNNGSTIHDGGIIIRVNGKYFGNQNRNVHDVNDAFSWNLGVTSRDSRSGINSVNFAVAATLTDATKMWLDSCISSGSTFDYETGSVSNIYTYNPTAAGTAVSGSRVSSYTP